MKKRNHFVIALVLAILLMGPQMARAQNPVSQFFAIGQLFGTGIDVFTSWGPAPASGDAMTMPLGLTDLTLYYVETGPRNDCRAGGDCKTHPYISFGDATPYEFVDTSWWLLADGLWRFQILNNAFLQHTAYFWTGTTQVQIGNTVTSQGHNSYPYVAMGYESLSGAKLTKPMYFTGANYADVSGFWHSFCPNQHVDAGDNGAVLFPCNPSTPGVFSIKPGIRAWLPSQMRP